jgi:voltage-gated potassium channel
MFDTLSPQQRRRIAGTGLVLISLIFGASLVYWRISDPRQSFVDCLYMTMITITTIGYGEIVPMDGKPWARLFTMGVALVGIGALTYLLSNITAIIVEGNITEKFWRRKMEKKADGMRDHYIVCGAGRVGTHIVNELRQTQRPFVIVENDAAILTEMQRVPDLVCIEGDPTDNSTLTAAGVDRAAGLFAATDEDGLNLVIALTARQLSPAIRVVARCQDTKNAEKIKRAGADIVVSPTAIGGLRMASEMVRPAATTFLDVMMRDRGKNLRVEEIPAGLAGRRLRDLNLSGFPQTLPLAVRAGDGWAYNPGPDHELTSDSVLIVMTTPDERQKVAEHLIRMGAGA